MKHQIARTFRKNPTDAERLLWARLRGSKVFGVRFRRQQPIGPFIADFFCSAAKLVIELDGDQHGEEKQRAHDAARSRWLEEKGYAVLRFSNFDFLKEPDRIVDIIEDVVRSRTPPRTA